MFLRRLIYNNLENRKILNGTNNLNTFCIRICFFPMTEFNKTGSMSLTTKAKFLQRYRLESRLWNQDYPI